MTGRRRKQATKRSRAEELRADFDRLGRMLDEVDPQFGASGAAALARERRMIGELLDQLEADEGEVPVVDQLASRRIARAGDPGTSARRRRSS